MRCSGYATDVEGADAPVIFVATGLERWAARWRLPRDIPIEQVGIGLRGWSPGGARCFISCGLAGGLTDSIEPGTVVIPAWVGLPSGERRPCFPPLVRRLVAGARRLGFEPVTDPLITTPDLVTGPARRQWAAQGYVAADMESGLLLSRTGVGAVLRIVLDTPAHELSPAWAAPGRALATPSRWPEGLRLGLTAPGYALRAAAIVRAALQAGPS